MSSISANVLGTWKKAKSVFIKTAGIWKPVKKAYVKVGNVWKLGYQQVIVPTIPPIQVYAFGQNQTVYPDNVNGVWVRGSRVAGGQRSFSLATFTSVGNQIDSQVFDLGGGSPAENASRMISYLNALVDGQVFCMFSYGDPSANHAAFGVPAAVARIGGVTYPNDMFFGSAYILIGKVGSPAIYEVNVGGDFGPTTGDPNAALAPIWQVVGNVPSMISP